MMTKTVEREAGKGQKEQGRKLPDGWRWVKFGDVVENFDSIRVPVSQKDREQRHGEYPYYGASGVIDTIDDYLFDGEYLLIGEDGANLLMRSTPIAFKASGKFWVNNHAHVIQPKECVLLDFLLHVFAVTNLEPYITGAAQPKLSQAKLNSIPIPLPPIEDQRRIVGILRDRLSSIETARLATQAQLEAAQALPAAYLRQIFDSPEAQTWEKKLLGDIADVTGGIQKTPNRKPNNFHKPYLTVRNVQRGYLDLSDIENFELTPKELDQYKLQKGDLLIVEGNGSAGHIGRNAIYKGELEDCVHQNHIIRVRLDQNLSSPEFISLYLNSDLGKSQILELAETTSGLYTLSVSKVNRLKVLLPKPSKQFEILENLRHKIFHSHDLCQSLQDQLDTINALPAALLRQAFNGEL